MATIIDSNGTPTSESSALSVIDVTLDIRQNRMVSVLLKQYNKQSQQIKFTVTDNGEKIELKEIEHTVLFKMMTPDGRRISSYCAINENDHTAVLTVAKNYCSYPGKGTAELEVMNALEESQIGTMNLDVIIENSVYPDEMINGSSTYQGLDEKINAVREVCNSAIVAKEETETIRDECVDLNNQTAQNTQLANDYANMAQSYANGESGAREGEETDNAKYYYNQTSLLKTDTETIKTELLEVQEVVNQKASAAESYATNASNSATEAENSASQTSIDRETVTALANEVNNKIGSPLTASTSSDMINQNKIYVYTGSEDGYTFGNWYYYDGSSWVSGGIYNSTAFETDSELIYAGQAADAKATGDKLSSLKGDLNDIACVKYSTQNRQSEMFTLYESNGYINNDTGQFVENELFRCYTFTTNKNVKVWFDTQQTWGQIAIYNGEIFVESNLIFIGSLSRNTLPYIDNKLVIQSGMNVVICIRNDVDFTLNFPEGYYINEKQISLIANNLLKPKIKIIPVTDTEFKVAVLNEKTGTYLYHIFKYEYYKDTVVGSAVWYSTFIQDEEGNNIMQGNTNFIHYLNEEGHTGHVGASHGCCVAVFDEFWADGKRFEPSALNEIIYCDTFRFTEKVKHYLIDTSNTTASTHAMPYLDENGNPIVESIEYLDGCWEVNNKIVIRNRLDIKRNNTTFLQCHAGMCCGFYPYFDNIVVNNKEYVWNKIESSDGINFTIANMSGSDRLFNLGGSSAVTGDEVILFGEKYRVKNRIIQNDGTRYKNSNMLIQMPPYADNRIKTYLMPCICSQSWESVSSGQTVETFNDGDILDTTIIREIDVSN